MLVKIEEISQAGLRLKEPLSLDLLLSAFADGENAGFRPEAPSTLSVSLLRFSGGVLVEGRFEAALLSPCKRCLTDVHLMVPVEFTLNLVPQKPPVESENPEDDGRAERAGSFPLQAADQEPFDGKRIDLDPIVREQILLALPMYAICRDDCRGLCGICGQNRNENQCSCETKSSDPRWAALKEIKLN